MKSVLILDTMSNIRFRINQIVSEKNIKIYGSGNSLEFFNLLYEHKSEIGLIIIEPSLYNEDGFQIIENMKKKKIDIPIMILTSNNSRDSFIKGIKSGAVDYILKPIEEKMLRDRIVRYVNEKSTEKGYYHTNLITNFEDTLKKEMMNADSDGTEVLIAMFSLNRIFPKSKVDEGKNEDALIHNLLYEDLKTVIKEPNYIDKFGITSFCIIVPKIGKYGINEVIYNVNHKFEQQVKSNDRFKNFIFENEYLIYPSINKTVEGIIKELRENLNKKVEISKNNIL